MSNIHHFLEAPPPPERPPPNPLKPLFLREEEDEKEEDLDDLVENDCCSRLRFAIVISLPASCSAFLRRDAVSKRIG